jgi:hypothetical protein
MTNPLTPEAEAPIEAARNLGLACKNGKFEVTVPAQTKFMQAYDAHEASLASKECRPPSDAKDGSLWWLTRGDGMKCVGGWMLADKDHEWDVIGHGRFTPGHGHAFGWTVHSECIFPGDRKRIDFANWSYNTLPERTGNVDWQPDLQDLIYTAINHVEGDYGDADENCAEQVIERLVLAIKSLLSDTTARAVEAHIRGDAE